MALIKGVLVQEKGIQFINENECPSAAAVNLGALDMLAYCIFYVAAAAFRITSVIRRSRKIPKVRLPTALPWKNKAGVNHEGFVVVRGAELDWGRANQWIF